MMKKVFLILLTLTVTVCMLSFEVSANLLSECHVCNTTGKCNKCHGGILLTCDQCDGSGQGRCDQCNDGYVICHICNGQKNLPCCDNPDCLNCRGTGARNCEQCSATGSEQCNGCKGTQYCNCTGCDGTGQITCDSCKNPGICNDCRGTGYLSGNNNGVNNIPRNGDTVELSVTGGGKTIIWGASGNSADGTSDTKSVNDRKEVSGDIPQTEPSLSSQTDPPISSQTELPENEERDYYIPENRSEINIGDNNQTATAFFHTDEMTVAEKDALNAMPEQELKQVLRDVDSIISSVKVGELSEKSEQALTQVLEKNKIQDTTSVKLCKLSFEGHITLDFPVKVSVNIDPSYFTEEDTIYAYHIADDGTVEFLGEAWRYADNGKVTRIEFMTKGLSDFFVTTHKLATEENLQLLAPLSENIHSWIYIASGAALVLLVVLTVVLLENRKRKQNT